MSVWYEKVSYNLLIYFRHELKLKWNVWINYSFIQTPTISQPNLHFGSHQNIIEYLYLSCPFNLYYWTAPIQRYYQWEVLCFHFTVFVCMCVCLYVRLIVIFLLPLYIGIEEKGGKREEVHIGASTDCW